MVRSDSYFTLVRNPAFDDAKIVMRSRWAKVEEMGCKSKSKTLKIKEYDTDGKPHNVFLVLRAWMLMRAARNDWISTKPRQKWQTLEIEQLKADIQAFGCSSRGHRLRCRR